MLQELTTKSEEPQRAAAVFPEPRTDHTLTFIPDQNAAWLVGGLSPKVGIVSASSQARLLPRFSTEVIIVAS